VVSKRVLASPFINRVVQYPAFDGIIIRAGKENVLEMVPLDKFHILGVARENSRALKF